MMKTVNVLQKGYRSALQYAKKAIDGKFGRIDERHARAKQSGLYMFCY